MVLVISIIIWIIRFIDNDCILFLILKVGCRFVNVLSNIINVIVMKNILVD